MSRSPAGWLAPLLPILLFSAGSLAEEASEKTSCMRIDRVTVFAPRGEVYVEVQPTCSDDDFERGDPLVAYLEVLLGDRPPAGQDVRVYRKEPRLRQTFEFRDLSFEAGDPILVRLVRFGQILSLQTIKAP